MNESALTTVEGPVVIACAAPFGLGGLGRHLRELVDFFRARHLQTEFFDAKSLPAWLTFARRFTPLRFSAAWQSYFEALLFDFTVSRRLPHAKTFIGFNGQAFRSLQSARKLDYTQTILCAATPHVN